MSAPRICLGILCASVLASGCRGRTGDAADVEQRVPQASRSPADDSSAEAAPAHTDDGAKPGKNAAERRGRGQAEASFTPPPNAIRSQVLIVNDQIIDAQDILSQIGSQLEKAAVKMGPREYDEFRRYVLTQEIEEAVVARLAWQEAKHRLEEAETKVIDKIVDRMEKERINREFDGREANYEKYLATRGKNRKQIREYLKQVVYFNQDLERRLKPLLVAPRREEVWRYYQNHLQEFRINADRREMFLIEVPIRAFEGQPGGDAPRVAAKKRIEEAMTRLKSGAAFEAVAREYSIGLQRDEGGAWGFITSPMDGGRYEAPSRRLYSLKPGEVSDIVETDDSFFIVKLGKHEPERVRSLGEVQHDIEEALQRERMEQLRSRYMRKAMEGAQVESYPSFLAAVLEQSPPYVGPTSSADPTE